ncbi:retrovirus-related Pol polyprotein from transposon TNT 1-94 [Trichonephila clavipes]|nr:retrovirus-related Pol polyprotein from transposon TNT 1-94 [Trichonephila clavipes]
MEFCHSKFSKYLNELGIRCERTNTYTPEQNGVSERFNLTAIDCVKAMLNTSGIEQCFWAEALVCFTSVKNRICHKFKDKTPYELYLRRKPTVSNLKVFGCHVYVGTPKQLRNKLDLRAKHGIILGYACSTREYRIWLLDDKKLIETCNILFDESKRVSNGILNFPSPNSRKTEWMEFKFNNPFNTFSYDDPDESDKDVRLRSFNDVEKYCKDNDILYDKIYLTSTVDHNANRPEASNIEVLIPRHFKDAKNSPQSDKWQDAMKEEIKVMKERDNFPHASLPIAKGAVLSKLDCPSNAIEVEEMSKFPYRNLSGCLSFIANRTRPDISHAVNILSQFQESSGIKQWDILLKLLGYLSDTRNLKLNLSHVERLKLNCFSDSDFAAHMDDRVSIGGLILMMHNVPISWRTFKHKCVSLSTMEAEYISLTEAAKEIIWIQNVINECNLMPKLNYSELPLIYCDNQAAINFSRLPVENHRTKHIDV